jgi:hypothetical protein
MAKPIANRPLQPSKPSYAVKSPTPLPKRDVPSKNASKRD